MREQERRQEEKRRERRMSLYGRVRKSSNMTVFVPGDVWVLSSTVWVRIHTPSVAVVLHRNSVITVR